MDHAHSSAMPPIKRQRVHEFFRSLATIVGNHSHDSWLHRSLRHFANSLRGSNSYDYD